MTATPALQPRTRNPSQFGTRKQGAGRRASSTSSGTRSGYAEAMVMLTGPGPRRVFVAAMVGAGQHNPVILSARRGKQ